MGSGTRPQYCVNRSTQVCVDVAEMCGGVVGWWWQDTYTSGSRGELTPPPPPPPPLNWDLSGTITREIYERPFDPETSGWKQGSPESVAHVYMVTPESPDRPDIIMPTVGTTTPVSHHSDGQLLRGVPVTWDSGRVCGTPIVRRVTYSRSPHWTPVIRPWLERRPILSWYHVNSWMDIYSKSMCV